MKRLFICTILFLSLCLSYAQDKATAPENWFNLDQQNDKVNGLGTERVYSELLKNSQSKTVIVGVIDSGVDIDHEDLKEVIWTNPGEIAGNGIDDDKNGYIDDVHGWNFIGGKDGKNISYERLEVTRLYKSLNDKYRDKTEETSGNKKEFKFYQEVKKKYNEENDKWNGYLGQISMGLNIMKSLNDDMKKSMNIEKVTKSSFANYKPTEAKFKQMSVFIKTLLTDDTASLDDLIGEASEQKTTVENRLKYSLNPDYDPRKDIVGDNENDPYEKSYGNNDVKGSDPTHGTHVAGIIAAVRNNNLGMKGVADNVRIMPVRAIPNGDERDKDVANAIIYAVDNGCQIINMSFGKPYAVYPEAVAKAVKYAESKGVLLVHAAGNDNTDTDLYPNYPLNKTGKKACKTWIEVGALSWKPGENIPAKFSNYGKKSVDLFAPGVDIYSTVPGSKYKNESGTSMACPATAGCAALLKSYFPELNAKQIKKILEKSVNNSMKDSMVNLPAGQGGKPVQVKFSTLSKTGGYVNLYEAVKMAQGMTKKKM